MRRSLTPWGTVFLVLFLLLTAAQGVDASPPQAGRYIVVLSDSVSLPGRIASAHARPTTSASRPCTDP
jgi:hypothetical protein